MLEEQGVIQNEGEKRGKLRELYARAFAVFGTRALWNMRQLDDPTREDILAMTRQLRIEGNLAARRFAEQLERMSLADL
jgi:hypothetical protein